MPIAPWRDSRLEVATPYFSLTSSMRRGDRGRIAGPHALQFTFGGRQNMKNKGTGVDVIIKSTFFGNQTVCGSLSGCPGAGCTITYTYTAPNGPSVCACNTSIVAYNTNGNNSNNDIIDDGIKNGTGTQSAGYAYV